MRHPRVPAGSITSLSGSPRSNAPGRGGRSHRGAEKASGAFEVMLARTPSSVGAALDSNDARLGRLQPAPANKINNTAEPIERSPAMFISPYSWQAAIRRPSAGRDDLTRIEKIGNL